MCRSALLLGVNKLANLRSLFIEIGEVLSVQLLVDLEFLLGTISLARVNVSLRKTVVCVGQIRIQLPRLEVFRDGISEFVLIRV